MKNFDAIGKSFLFSEGLVEEQKKKKKDYS